MTRKANNEKGEPKPRRGSALPIRLGALPRGLRPSTFVPLAARTARVIKRDCTIEGEQLPSILAGAQLVLGGRGTLKTSALARCSAY